MAMKNKSCKTLQLPIIGAGSISIRNTPIALASLVVLFTMVFGCAQASAQIEQVTPNQATPEERAAAMQALMEGAPPPSEIKAEPSLDWDSAYDALQKTKQHSKEAERWGLEPRIEMVPAGVDPQLFIQQKMIKAPEVDGKFLDGPKTINPANITPIAADPNAARVLPNSISPLVDPNAQGLAPQATPAPQATRVQPAASALGTPAPELPEEDAAYMTATPRTPLSQPVSTPAAVQSAPPQAMQTIPAQASFTTPVQVAPSAQGQAFSTLQSPAQQFAAPVQQVQQTIPVQYAGFGQPSSQLGQPTSAAAAPAARPASTMVTREWSVKDWVVPTKTPAAVPAKPAATPTSAKPAQAGGHALALVLVSPFVVAAEGATTPEDSVRLYNSAVKLHLSGKLDEAIEAYGEALKANPELGQAFCNRGLIYNQKHQYDKALEEFHKSLAIDPKDAITYNGIGAALRAKKDMAGAIKNWQTAITLDPKLATAHYNLGTAYEIQKDYDEAIDAYTDATSHDPKLGEAMYRKGLLLIKIDKIDQAKELLSKSLKATPNAQNAEYSASARAKLAQLESAESKH